MDWVPIVLVAWVLSSAPIAVVVGRAIHLAQQPGGRGGVGALRSFPRVVGIRTTASRSPAIGSRDALLPSEEPSPGVVIVRTLATDDQRTGGPDEDEPHGGTHPR